MPAEDAAYELTLMTTKIGSPAEVWKRSTRTETTWAFRSERKPDVASQGLPLLFPRYDVPSDGMKTVPAKNGQKIGLGATGHAGYTPGELTGAKVSFSYDGGETWHTATTAQQAGLLDRDRRPRGRDREVRHTADRTERRERQLRGPDRQRRVRRALKRRARRVSGRIAEPLNR